MKKAVIVPLLLLFILSIAWAQISGGFTMAEATDLAIALRAGALPAPVEVLEERNVGPSLGADSIRQGVISILVGFLLVMVFMAFYYKLSGAVAVMALLLNLILLMGALGLFEATLTLPGIAGIVLTVGMAVDANVLIFERIREELRLGKTIRSAIDAGYGKAFYTILDANVTTLIAALVLLQFGTGPIKGFAITLSIGIIASMFTAIFVTRFVYDFALSRSDIRSLSIWWKSSGRISTSISSASEKPSWAPRAWPSCFPCCCSPPRESTRGSTSRAAPSFRFSSMKRNRSVKCARPSPRSRWGTPWSRNSGRPGSF